MLILMTHGEMAKGVLNSAKLIVGNIKRSKAICVKPYMGIEEAEVLLKNELIKRKEKEDIFILVDIIGGTPYNVATRLAQGTDYIKIISGLSLAMVIQYALSSADTSIDKALEIIEAGKNSTQLIDVNRTK